MWLQIRNADHKMSNSKNEKSYFFNYYVEYQTVWNELNLNRFPPLELKT